MTNKPTLAVVAFPGNNCEVETARAAQRNGFEAKILRWNQADQIGDFDAYILPGGFSFEDRGRSGALAAREPIFDELRKEAQKGKLVLGICNGAQMIVESGLIPILEDPLPLSLAENVRRDSSDHVIGTGYYNVWCNLKVTRKNTAFTQNCQDIIRVPIAHGEGRFTTQKENILQALKKDDQVAFRYCDENGEISNQYPVTPNGAHGAIAMIVNKEGTVGAIMPHPERFYKTTEGDQVLHSMQQWVVDKKSPKEVIIGDLSTQDLPDIEKLKIEPNTLYLEKSLMITDNENFSVKSVAEKIVGSSLSLEKTEIYAISGKNLEAGKLLSSGLIFNPNKENIEDFEPKKNQFLVQSFEDDEALYLAEQLSDYLGTNVSVQRFKAWDFGNEVNDENVDKILKNGLFCNPNAGKICTA